MRGSRFLFRSVSSGALAVCFCFGTMVSSAMAYDLQRHVWQDRLLFLVAPEIDDPGLQRQLAVVEQRHEAVLDRDLRVFVLTTTGGQLDGSPLSKADVSSLRDQLRLAPYARALLLIGLDGGIKSRTPLDTSLSSVFRQIDAMPMRQQELRERSSASPE